MSAIYPPPEENLAARQEPAESPASHQPGSPHDPRAELALAMLAEALNRAKGRNPAGFPGILLAGSVKANIHDIFRMLAETHPRTHLHWLDEIDAATRGPLLAILKETITAPNSSAASASILKAAQAIHRASVVKRVISGERVAEMTAAHRAASNPA